MAGDENGSKSLMHTPLDNLTRALFATLRGGGDVINEENEYINIMRTCPICKTGLETLLLGNIKEDGQIYERMLWRCPRQPTKECYFPMNILPLDVFWIKRTIEQMENNIKPLPNLHLLPEHRHYLYPKLFHNSKDKRIDIERIITVSSFVPLGVNRSSISNVSVKTQPLAIKTAPSSSSLKLPTKSATKAGEYRSLAPLSQASTSNQSVGSYLKEKLQSGELRVGAKACENESRKMADLCPNTAAALKSHLILNGNASDELVLQALNSEAVRRELANPMSQSQIVRLQGQVRSALMRMDEQNSPAGIQKEEQRQLRRGTRQRAQTPRYIPIPEHVSKILKSESAMEEMPREEEGRRRKGNNYRQRTSYQHKKMVNTKSIREAINKLEHGHGKWLPARFGVDGTPMPSGPIEANVPTHYELIEGCLPDEDQQQHRQQPSELHSSGAEGSSTNAMASLSSNSSRSSKKRSWKIDQQMRVDAVGCGGTELTTPMDSAMDEKMKLVQGQLFREAIKRRKCVDIAQTPPANPAPMHQTHSAMAPDSQTELAGIPHDFAQHGATSHIQRISQLVPINYTEEEAANRFATYDRHNAAIGPPQQELAPMDENDEFDFGFGLDDEFQGNEGGEVSDNIFLRNLSNG